MSKYCNTLCVTDKCLLGLFPNAVNTNSKIHHNAKLLFSMAPLFIWFPDEAIFRGVLGDLGNFSLRVPEQASSFKINISVRYTIVFWGFFLFDFLHYQV